MRTEDLNSQMTKRLYVGNLAYHTTEDALQAAFSQDGRTVESVHIMLDRDTGRSRGFAFVEMGTDEDARGAIEAMNGADLDGRPLRVNEAEERRPRSGAFGGGARSGGGSFGGPRGGGGAPRREFRDGGGGGGGGGGFRDRGDRGGGGDRERRDFRRERRERRDRREGRGDGW